jgi:RecB family exonuclease
VRPESGHLPLLAETYQLYVDALAEHDLYDDADLFQEAVRIVEERSAAGETVYAVFGETELHESALELVRAFHSEGTAFYILGPTSSEAPKTTAAFALRDDSSSETETESPFATGFPELFRAAGPQREARAVFRNILSNNQSLDEVEIAYTASHPYLTLLADEAERLGIPFTLGTGLPLMSTRPGQALAGFYEWIESGYEAPVLIRLLRNGLLQPDKWIEKEGYSDVITGHGLASVLAERRYGPGKEAYSKAIEAGIEAVKNPPEERPKENGLSKRDEREIRRLQVAQSFVEDVLELVQDSGSARKLAANSLKFLSTFGPKLNSSDGQGDAMVSEEDNTTEEIASAVLRGQVLQQIQEMPFKAQGSPAQMARLFREALENRYVGAQSATSGAVHILPLDSAGFSGREHLYVVGMDSETASVPVTDNPILTSEKRSGFSEGRVGMLPQPRNAATESAWRFNQALKRHRGSTTLLATTFDPNEGEERHPSTLFLEALTRMNDKAVSDLPLEGLVPSTDTLLLDGPEAWLYAAPAAVRARKNTSASSIHEHPEGVAARTLLHERFPWIGRGEEARRKRRSEEHTEYDGLLKRATPELDFLSADYDGPPISAGRLEMLAEAPYAYFLKYVLGVEPREEPALEEEPWLNPRRKGIILHRSFSRFMSERDEVHGEDRRDLLAVLRDVAEEEAKRVYPGTDATFEEALRELRTCARLFFQSELRRSGRTTPILHEWGFGYGERHRQKGDAGDVDLDLDAGSLPVRGRIDRVDRREDGKVAVWDYKTGSQSSFSRSEPLKNGQKIQWALYSLVLEQCRNEEVAESGYFFTSEKEMGTRLSFPMNESNRADTNEVISRLAGLVRNGTFPIAPDAHNNSPWRWGDWDHLFRDLEERVDALEGSYSEDITPEKKPRPHFLEDK